MTQTQLECDLIMRGGIASGLVYPTAVAELSKTFRFRRIGGASAGAIGAAVTAAAESGRREKKNQNAFKRLAEIPDELGRRDGGPMSRSKLFRLFRSQRGTAPLFWLVVTLMRSMKDSTEVQLLKLLGTLLLAFLVAAIIGALPGFVGAAFVLTKSGMLQGYTDGIFYLLLAVVFSCILAAAIIQVVTVLLFRNLSILAVITLLLLVGLSFGATTVLGTSIADSFYVLPYVIGAMLLIYVAAAGAALSCAYAAVRRAQRELPRNMYGLCPGYGSRRKDGTPQLTEWLHELIQEAAGRKATDSPLTMGDLWGSAESADSSSISIALMTTDITRGTSHTFPQLEGEGAWRGALYFKSSEFERLFPPVVVKWMVDKAGDPLQLVDERGNPSADTDVYRLPAPSDLPLLLGARMSMSFPFLLGMVPLYTPDKTDPDDNPITLHKLWFSDGGLASNFPIHFFDSMVPRRPTFGISLAYDDSVFKDECNAPAFGFKPTEDWLKYGPHVLLPSTNNEGAFAFARFADFDNRTLKISGFFGALFDASREWADNELINMPGYRDRIVHVRLAHDEGGYNLDMPSSVIKRIAMKGKLAGEILAARYSPNPGRDPKTGQPIELGWDNHRWIRYRGFMSALEELARQFQDRWKQEVPASGKPVATLRDLIERSGQPECWSAYPWGSRKHFDFACDVTSKLADFVDGWDKPYHTFDWDEGRAPRPKLRLRVTPPDDSAGAPSAFRPDA